jgi:hypothetical protein
VGYLLRGSSDAAKSENYFKEKIDDMIAKLAADYQKQNAEASPKRIGADNPLGYDELAALWSEIKSFAFLTTILAYANLSDKDSAIRANAVRIIGLFGREKDIQTLEEVAQEDPDETVRKAAAEALEAIRKDK